MHIFNMLLNYLFFQLFMIVSIQILRLGGDLLQVFSGSKAPGTPLEQILGQYLKFLQPSYGM